ncbi:MAG: hypothetical protein M9958_07225 [Chitinophagales bacterium]|nr:hypothetical protein [Chitinophagales bacterium]
MMKRWLSILFVILFVGINLASSQEIVISPSIKISSKLPDYEILGKNSNGIYIHYSNGTLNELELLNQQLRSVSKREILLKDKSSQLESIFLRNRGAVVFYSSLAEGYQYLKARYINDYLETSAEAIILDSIPKNKSNIFAPYYIKQSSNMKYFAFFKIEEDKQGMAVKYQILNNDLELVGGGTFENLQKDIVLKSFKINNQGVVYATMAHQVRSGGDPNNYIYDELYTFLYDPHLQIGKQQVIEKTKRLRFKNIITEIDNLTNTAYTVASYRSVDTDTDIGVLAISSNVSSSESMHLKYAFDELSMSNMHSFKAKDWKEQALIIKPKSVIPQSDSGCLIIMEGQYQYTKVVRGTPYNGYYPYYNMADNYYTRTYNQNHYFDISSLSISGKGEVNWEVVMPKVQVTEDDGGIYSSFSLFESNNLLKFLFNEDIYANGNFVEYNLNPKGITMRKSLLNTKKENLTLIPQKGVQLSATEILIPSEQKRNLQFILFKY